MADRLTFASVTKAACRCGYLRRAADDPALPIVFHRPTGEFHFQYQQAESEGYSTLIIFHCPFCGGAAPRSKRPLLFHVIPPDEERRLTRLLAGITTVRGALRKLGPPEYDNPRGTGLETPERPGRGPTKQWYRALCYQKLSKVADVWFTERGDGRASWYLQGKAKKRRPSARRG
jgi:hypothetical protein